MQTEIKNKKLIYTFVSAVIIWFSACGNNEDKNAAAAAENAQEPAPSFPVYKVEAKNTTLNNDYPATLQGEQNIDIRPMIDGYIEQIFIDEGSVVKKGQPLFRIRAPQYAQEVNEAEAAISTAQADLSAAQLQVNKAKPLVEKEIISHFELENAEYTLKARQAALKQARAKLVTAKTNLGYTLVSSPVNGVAGTIPYRLGSLITASTEQPLTTISSIGKIYAYFSLNEKQLLTFLRTAKGNGMPEKIKNTPAVSLILSDGTNYAEKGRVETISGLISTETGSANFRAKFGNPDALIRSGGSATVRIPQSVENAILVPQKSTFELQGKRFVYVVDGAGKVKNTEIETMDIASGEFYVVTKGLQAGAVIVLQGAANLQDGMSIKPEMKTSANPEQASK